MLKVTFKQPQDFNSNLIGGFVCKFIYATKIFYHKDNKYCLIRLSNHNFDFVIYDTKKNNIKSIEHVKPTDL